jgi:TatD DNase family protein
MYVDTHCHLNFKAFSDDADEIIQQTLGANIWMIIVGVETKTSKRAIEHATRYERGVYAAAGLHPIHLYRLDARDDDYDFVTSGEEFDYEAYKRLASAREVVAIGEVGLDYHHIPQGADLPVVKGKQREVFLSQLALARELNKPAIIHCREAHDDMLATLKEVKKEHRDELPTDRPWGVMHCFTGSLDLAWEYFALGLSVSFTGLITFNRQWDELIRKLPLDKFMIETDAPFMTPVPYRGQRNLPDHVIEVARKIAEIKNIPLEKIADISTENAKKLFCI